jgi:hypothetical protein
MAIINKNVQTADYRRRPILAFPTAEFVSQSRVLEGTNELIKAGTPVSVDLLDRSARLKVDTENPNGVLLHDTEVNESGALATILLSGYVAYDQLDTEVQAMLTEPVRAALLAQGVKFIAVAL